MSNKNLEIANLIGCPCRCLKYCPQEIVAKKYGAENRVMTLATFKQILNNVPKNISLCFSGNAEPLYNPDCVEMIKYAVSKGHIVDLNTTLYGAQKKDIEELKRIRFRRICFHLPDGTFFKEPLTPGYRDNVMEFITGIPNLEFMSMNDLFQTNHREDITRGILPKPRRYGHCVRFNEFIAPVVLPNGKCYLCCMDFGFQNYVGDLLTERYDVIVERVLAKKGKYNLCRYCSQNQTYATYIIRKVQARINKVYHKVMKDNPRSFNL